MWLVLYAGCADVDDFHVGAGEVLFEPIRFDEREKRLGACARGGMRRTAARVRDPRERGVLGQEIGAPCPDTFRLFRRQRFGATRQV